MPSADAQPGLPGTHAQVIEFDSLPLVLTVEEAARVLRIGRSAAYDQTALYQATDGAAGLPVVRLGRSLRVPRHELGRILGIAPHSGRQPVRDTSWVEPDAS
jgi:hypothetical protein